MPTIVSGQNIPGNNPVSFSEAFNLFKSACIAAFPSYQASRQNFQSAGLTLSTITAGSAHPDKGLTGRSGSFRAADGTDVSYCELSALIPEDRTAIRSQYRGAVRQAIPTSVLRDEETLTALQEGILSIFKVESSISSGRATFSVMSSYVN
jgi:hypothetical protein